MPTTEVCNLSLIAGSDIGDPDNTASSVLKDCGNTLLQQNGIREVRFGTQTENADQLELFITWDSKKNHEDFMAADQYKAFYKRFATIFTGGPAVHHVDFEPVGGYNSSVSAGITEVATVYGDGDVPDEYIKSAQKFFEISSKADKRLLGFAVGLSQEQVDFEGKKGRVAMFLVGWASKESHMEFRDTDTFKENIHLLRHDSVKKIEMHHTSFLNLLPS